MSENARARDVFEKWYRATDASVVPGVLKEAFFETFEAGWRAAMMQENPPDAAGGPH